jgi:hypothetical protein
VPAGESFTPAETERLRRAVLNAEKMSGLEIITGREARRILSDTDCGLAAATMQVSFVAGDLVEGLATGIQQLGEAAHHPRTLHATVNPVDSRRP